MVDWLYDPADVSLDDLGNVTADGTPIEGATAALVRNPDAAPGDPDEFVLGTIDGAASGGLSTRQAVDEAAPLTLYTNGPQAAYDPTTARTFFAWLGLERDCYVAYHDHLTGVTADPVLVGVYPLPDADDHGAPTINIGADGTLHIWWGGHGNVTNLRYSRSDSPRDIAAWTTTVMHPGTYPCLVVTDDGDLFVFTRAGDWHSADFPSHEYIGWRRSTNGGTSWSDDAPCVDTTGSPEAFSDAYLRGASFEPATGLVHLSWTVARGSGHDGDRTNVYHATFDPATETMRNAAGADLGPVVTWAEHDDCLAAAAVPVPSIRHLVHDDGRIFVAFTTGTPVSGEAGDYSVHVATWDGTSWSTVDTGIPQEWRFSDAILAPHGDGLVGIFCSRTGSRTDLTAWTSPDGATWYEIGTLAAGTDGEGWERLAQMAGRGPWLTLAQQMPDGWARTSATASDLGPLIAVEGLFVGPHTHDYADADHTHDGPDHSNETVFPPAYTVTDGVTLEVSLEVTWGIDAAGDPYYNAAGVTPGDEAVLVLDNVTGDFSLRPIEVP